ncbi:MULTISPECIES: molybdopterin-dependent oxidoreductase [Edwardsiella]|uniref:Sulfite oxidase-related enzyme n=2 Tax=Edwardsiella anguillarum TaxID=1821960 RepID=A0A076LL39_9GAMM|nr:MULTISPECIES: molybdopterin-dependent oxidoreductase [Edwardsiella]AIJ09165.1 Sulfite oxidase-related enzyme [Edwardsiella anguillarum ET080813]AKR77095.1 molybdopterin-dependent oxidoreductase [Edwardsiella sp. LADL05-105]KAB0589985.1 molybdopterin-dependent oxidoreductase [Edwardsiella anguillarum]MDA6076103.1 molybdopterin-dependent oxidoreductase [Edwardsiella anguillarum]UOU80234.1 molybdopterin-dependent oxidoreductase [Edwardsiella anguillarum]
MKKSNIDLSVGDGDALVKEAQRLVARRLDGSSRRRFLQQGLTLGGIALLTGCDLSENPDVESVLNRMSRFNDRVQGWLFSGQRLAPEYTPSEITRPFPFNAFYGEEEIPDIAGDDYRLEVRGLVRDTRSWRLAELYQLTQHEQITRHICVEGWSAIGRWGGVRFADFLQLIGAQTQAKYVGFRCADDYYTSIDMASALHPQTIMALSWDGQRLPPEYGYPMKLRIPTKLGYKNPKHIVSIEITNRFPGGYWEDQGYNWFGGS